MTKRKISSIVNYFSIFVFLILTIFYFNYFLTRASDERLDFDEYVRLETRNKSGDEKENSVNNVELSNLLYDLLSLAVSSIGIIIFFISRSKYITPHKCEIDDDIFEFGKLEGFVNSLTVLEVSSIVNVCEYSKYDIIAVIFDLITKGIFKIQFPPQFDKPEKTTTYSEPLRKTKIVIDADKYVKSQNSLSHYENFLINWFLAKIGDKSSFAICDIGEYVSLSSRAVEFDIDYDIWLDEVKEYIRYEDIVDMGTEKWKLICGYFKIIYALFGLITLYTIGSMASVSFFFGAFIINFFSDNAVRRSKSTQLKFQLLEKYWSIVTELAKNNSQTRDKTFDSEEEWLWGRRFVYGIAIANLDNMLITNEKYVILYRLLECELENAIASANIKINEAIVTK